MNLNIHYTPNQRIFADFANLFVILRTAYYVRRYQTTEDFNYICLSTYELVKKKNENRMSRMENLHREREVNPYNLLLHVNTTNALRFYSDTFHIYVRKIPEKHCKNFIFIFINPHFFWMLQNFQ